MAPFEPRSATVVHARFRPVLLVMRVLASAICATAGRGSAGDRTARDRARVSALQRHGDQKPSGAEPERARRDRADEKDDDQARRAPGRASAQGTHRRRAPRRAAGPRRGPCRRRSQAACCPGSSCGRVLARWDRGGAARSVFRPSPTSASVEPWMSPSALVHDSTRSWPVPELNAAALASLVVNGVGHARREHRQRRYHRCCRCEAPQYVATRDPAFKHRPYDEPKHADR